MTEEQEQHEQMMEDAAIFLDGMQSPFWKRLERMLDDLREDSVRQLLSAPSDDRGLIAELQAAAKIGDRIKNTMLCTINYAKEQTQ